VRPDGNYLVVNLPSAAPSRLFVIDHDTGTATPFKHGHTLRRRSTGIVIGADGHYYVAELGARAVIRWTRRPAPRPWSLKVDTF